MTTIAIPLPEARRPGRLTLVLRYLRRTKSLAIGLSILFLLIAFTVIGLLTIDTKAAYPLAVRSKQPPSVKYPFGTDFFGRNLLAVAVELEVGIDGHRTAGEQCQAHHER